MIDIHAHLLPGIDDGPAEMAEALEMCRLVEEDGCTHILATPHRYREWPSLDRNQIARRTSRLQQAYEGKLQVLPGAEVHMTESAVEELLSPGGSATPLGESQFVLLELADSLDLGRAEDLLHELRVAGWRPIVAHPEFVPALIDRPEIIGSWCDRGIRFQATAMSVTGSFGSSLRRRTARLIDKGWIHFVASDAHSATWRPPGLGAARAAIARTWGERAATELTETNATEIINCTEAD